jgi:hypothetical protein
MVTYRVEDRRHCSIRSAMFNAARVYVVGSWKARITDIEVLRVRMLALQSFLVKYGFSYSLLVERYIGTLFICCSKPRKAVFGVDQF